MRLPRRVLFIAIPVALACAAAVASANPAAYESHRWTTTAANAPPGGTDESDPAWRLYTGNRSATAPLLQWDGEHEVGSRNVASGARTIDLTDPWTGKRIERVTPSLGHTDTRDLALP